MRQIVIIPDPRLRRACEPVKRVDSYIKALVQEMLAILAEANTLVPHAYGLAAPQLGESVQVFVISTVAVQLVVLNPKVTKFYGQHSWVEGCLSLPGALYVVSRPKLIKFQYLDLNGVICAHKFHDDFAGIAQHEIQHLSGILIDVIGSPVSREAVFQK